MQRILSNPSYHFSSIHLPPFNSCVFLSLILPLEQICARTRDRTGGFVSFKHSRERRLWGTTTTTTTTTTVTAHMMIPCWLVAAALAC
ncbi:hypothetical protein IMY05_004G0170300 [Salix suchowensis]|nr:hypothetical protein IMY05_004G0170300 [Salix suchowensis]